MVVPEEESLEEEPSHVNESSEVHDASAISTNSDLPGIAAPLSTNTLSGSHVSADDDNDGLRGVYGMCDECGVRGVCVVCGICHDVVCFDSLALKSHIIERHMSVLFSSACPLCSQPFNDTKQFVQHVIDNHCTKDQQNVPVTIS